MKQRNYWVLAVILVLTGLTVWLALPDHPGIHIGSGERAFDRDVRIHQGLDLQGGIQVLLEADLPPDADVDTQAMSTARRIIEEQAPFVDIRVIGQFEAPDWEVLPRQEPDPDAEPGPKPDPKP